MNSRFIGLMVLLVFQWCALAIATADANANVLREDIADNTVRASANRETKANKEASVDRDTLTNNQTKAVTQVSPKQNIANRRIITLSPHLTEIVYALGAGDDLVAVSDYSDYPLQASSLPSVANFEGVNIAQVLRLQPTHILAWKGGNKQNDLLRLQDLGFEVFASAPNTVEDLSNNILDIGRFIGQTTQAAVLSRQTTEQLTNIKQNMREVTTLDVVYVMNALPLSGSGKDMWVNSLLGQCMLNNIYANASSSYIQISMADVLRKAPDMIISSTDAIHQVMAKHKDIFRPEIVVINPDSLHRFTPRVLPELKKLCRYRKSF